MKNMQSKLQLNLKIVWNRQWKMEDTIGTLMHEHFAHKTEEV